MTVCNVWLTFKQARARKVHYKSQCGCDSTEFFEIKNSSGGVFKIARCPEHAKSVGRGLQKEDVKRITAGEYAAPVRVWDKCTAHPLQDEADTFGITRDRRHECMEDELRCVYCGVKVEPVQCNGCGRFMSCREIVEAETRCTDCR